MGEDHTTIAVQRFLGQLEGDAPPDPIVRALLERSVDRLHLLCATMLARKYPRLMRPPLNLQSEEMLSAVVERLIKAMREVRPQTPRQFFALANRHMRWELNDLARRLDERSRAAELREEMLPSPATSGSVLSPNAARMLDAIDRLPEEEREVFELVRIQGTTHAEAAEIVGVSPKTVQRRLNRAMLLLSDQLGDLRPAEPNAG
ncbi:MAG: sigma-70 family RNA polymerase sigma factor [Phycisphaerales bacterium]|nr:sigma-70 family RNA polymerase sigma factor [Phycisphaerales bacterium]